MAEVLDTTSYQWPQSPWKKTDAVDDKASVSEDEVDPVTIDVLKNDTNATGVYKIFPVKQISDVSLTDSALTDSVAAAEDYTTSLSTKPYTITLESGATVTLENGQVTYDPNGQFEHLNNGQTASDSFGYAAYGRYNTDRARVDVTITGVDEPTTGNHPPDAVNDTAYLPSYYPYPLPYEETAGSTTATTTDAPLSDDLIATTLAIGEEGDPYPYPSSVDINVLANDTDADGNPLHVATIAGQKVDTDDSTPEVPASVTLDSGATVKLNADGSLTYTENGKYVDIELEPVPLPEQDATLTASSDGSGELVQIDPILPPLPWYWLVDSFTYSASDGTLSDEATVDVCRMSGWYALDSADPVA